jgi:hypothetical protein
LVGSGHDWQLGARGGSAGAEEERIVLPAAGDASTARRLPDATLAK